MERAFPGPDQPIALTLGDPDYEHAHAARSARIVGDWLREQGASAVLIGEVERLIRAHETGGWPEADLVQAADSLSFLEMNIDLVPGLRAQRTVFVEPGALEVRAFVRAHPYAGRQGTGAPLMLRALDKLDAQELEMDTAGTAPIAPQTEAD